MDDIELNVGLNNETGMYQGLVYRNHKKPSGCDRWLLQYSTAGYDNAREAAKVINSIFPDVKQIDINSLPLPMPPFPPFPVDTEITLVEPKDKEPPYVEVNHKVQDITETQIRIAVLKNFLELDSGSGNDPELSAIYTHYRVL